MANMKHVAKAIANRELLTSEHAQVIAKEHVNNKVKLAKAKQAKKEAAKPKAKKTAKKGK